jgi:hypothetical protein
LAKLDEADMLPEKRVRGCQMSRLGFVSSVAGRTAAVVAAAGNFKNSGSEATLIEDGPVP